MTQIKITVTGSMATAQLTGIMTCGMVGLPVTFSFDREWDSLKKTAVFQAGGLTVDRVDLKGKTTVPPEIMAKKYCTLFVGVYGASEDGSIVIPTVWAEAGMIQPGADPSGDESTDPALPVWQAALNAIGDLSELHTQEKRNLVSAVNEAYNRAGKTAGQINDAMLSREKTWSSQKIVDQCSPAFRESGSAVSCEPVEGYPLEVVSKIIPKQSGSGDPSPENVRPIVNWTGAKLWRGGKNLLPDGWDDWSNYTAHYTDDNPKVFPFELPPGKYCISVECDNAGGTKENYVYLVKSTDGGQRYTEENALGAGKAGYILAGKSTEGSIAFEVTDDPNEKWGVWARSYDVPYIKYLQIEIGSVATAYEPYRGEEITIDFGQSVYGGSYNWKTGELVVDKAYMQLTSDCNMYIYEYGSYAGVVFKGVLAESLTHANGICSHSPVEGSDNSFNMWIGVASANIYWVGVLTKLGLSTVDEFKAWLDTQNVQVCYELPTPTTIQLTPQEILALNGANTLYSDTGDTTVSGRADTSAVIEKLTNAIIALGGNV